MIERLKIAWYSRTLKNLPPKYDHYLNQYNPYYQQLNPGLQKKFRERTYICSRFIDFKPIKFDQVSSEMKIVITSALVQITFGLDRYILRKFKTIMVVPNTYSFREYKALLGHVDYQYDLIAMSWPSVVEGFIIPDDAFNVALHEISHALQNENHERLVFSKFFALVNMKNWKAEGLKELLKIRKNKESILRVYAGQNMVEMFAVCVETFFEQPSLFKDRLPELFQVMVELLHQDPSKGSNPLDLG